MNPLIDENGSLSPPATPAGVKVFGCTGDAKRNVVSVEMSVETIIQAGIDPLRVDLFDPNPLIMNVGGEAIRFKRKDEFVFVDTLESTVVVGVDDGVNQMCFEGDMRNGCSPLRIGNVRRCKTPFRQAFARFLEKYLANASLRPIIFIGDPALPKSLGGFHDPIPRQEVSSLFCGPLSAARIKMQGSQLSIEEGEKLTAGTYCGKMLETLRLPGVVLPEEINWVFETLGAVTRPVVFGQGLRKAITGAQPERIEFLVPSGDMDLVRRTLPADVQEIEKNPHARMLAAMTGGVHIATGSSFEFLFQERRYSFTEDLPTAPSRETFTVDALASDGPSTLIGTRIALFDLGERLFRRSAGVTTSEFKFWRTHRIGFDEDPKMGQEGFSGETLSYRSIRF